MAHDSRDYYRLLNLEPGASVEEINLAYGFLKYEWEKENKPPGKKLQEAFECLADPQRKAAYDAKPGRAAKAEWSRNTILVGLLVALLVFAGFVFPGFLRPGPSPYHSGDRLIRRSTGQVLGDVVRRESVHRFTLGSVGPGYLVRTPDGIELWFPANELERHFEKN